MLKETRKKVMEEHIEYLCKLHQIDKMLVSNTEAAEAWIEHRIVWIPVLSGPMAYYVALHEIGHIVTFDAVPRLEREARAWTWALEIGKIGVTKPVYRFVKKCIKRYSVLEPDAECPSYYDLLARLARNSE